MAELRVLEPRQTRDQKSVVEFLERELEAARRGEYVAVCMAAVVADGSGHHGWAASTEGHRLVAALEIAKHLLLVEITAGVQDVT